MYLKINCGENSLIAVGFNPVCAHRCAHNVEMGIVNRVFFLGCSSDDTEGLRVYHFMTAVCGFAYLTHTDASVNARYAHT
ncbi:MAG: hypothetical protein A4E63_03037 [Syntrophorhabdus sp. PtaU1.Bin050]|nr:MAG: hypothetical protein A4E63_03037 [Syntrophorhabdus sp. PtaU1.Bin050]